MGISDWAILWIPNCVCHPRLIYHIPWAINCTSHFFGPQAESSGVPPVEDAREMLPVESTASESGTKDLLSQHNLSTVGFIFVYKILLFFFSNTDKPPDRSFTLDEMSQEDDDYDFKTDYL